MFKWPLNVSNFTWLDRIKICLFFLNPKNYWTQGKYVKEFEEKMAKFMGYKYAVFVSSGSTANTILAMYLKDKLEKEGKFKNRNIVVLPSTTWQTSCAPWIREGFKPHFIDISLYNFGMDLEKLKKYLIRNGDKVAAVFPTSLLGCNTNIGSLKFLQDKYKDVYFAIDECENTFGCRNSQCGFTCTTSTYFGHQLQSVEGGFLFTNNENECQEFLMYRNHGMTRSIQGYFPLSFNYNNYNVDGRFDFYNLGNNFRNSDINAFIGLLDFNRIFKYIEKRIKISKIFNRGIFPSTLIMTPDNSILFCLPIIINDGDKAKLEKIEEYCNKNKIETRPIISGFLGYHTPYKKYMKENKYPNSVYLHKYGIYIGLHTKLKEKQVKKLTDDLTKLCK